MPLLSTNFKISFLLRNVMSIIFYTKGTLKDTVTTDVHVYITRGQMFSFLKEIKLINMQYLLDFYIKKKSYTLHVYHLICEIALRNKTEDQFSLKHLPSAI